VIALARNRAKEAMPDFPQVSDPVIKAARQQFYMARLHGDHIINGFSNAIDLMEFEGAQLGHGFMRFGTKTNQSMADTLGSGDAENSIDNDTHIIHAFTDGSLIRKKSKNGETKLLCGYGIYIPAYGLMDELRYAGTIRDNKTNNRGELKAIIEALNYILDFIDKVTGGVGGGDGGDGGDSAENEKLKKTKIVIYTDSSYSKLILGDTGVKYRKAGYLVSKKSGEEVKNADMVQEIMEIRDKISAYGMELIVKHVYAHTNLDTFEANGNRLADEYANIGANKTHLHAND
jgi:ribonuclease HI